MSGGDLFWFLAGTLMASALAFILPPLWRTFERARPLVRYGAIGGAAFVLTVLSLTLYAVLGTPQSASSRSVPHASQMSTTTEHSGNSLAQATAALAARLEREGGTDADWDLLAQSYAYAGDAAAAAEARAHRTAKASVPASAAPTGDEASYRALVERDPGDGRAWLAIAQIARGERRFDAAKAAYEKAIPLHVMSADSWADYADVLATVSGSLRGAPSDAIGKSLATNPRHSKALWLAASLALEERRYPDALALWKRLRSVVPDGSPDSRIVDANIAEATALVQGAPTKVLAVPNVAIRGRVAVDPALQARVRSGMTLFVYAKAPSSPGPPVAVLRTRTSTWPVSFQLDDSLAMVPGRALSGFDSVIVEARLSDSGDALARPGDLQAMSGLVQTRNPPPLELRLTQVVH